MSHRRLAFLGALLALPLLAVAGHAQSLRTVGMLSVGYTSIDEGITLTGGVGPQLSFLRLAAYGDLILSEDEDSRFARETFDNGRTVCRDLDTGQFAEDSYCGPEVHGAVRGELLLTIPGSRVYVGPGIRGGADGVRGYGTALLEYPLSAFPSRLLLKGSLGDDYTQFEVGLAFGG